MPDIVILGAGLTGISAAYHLEQAGFLNYKIFEKGSRPGGLLQSVQQDGFTFDYTGHLRGTRLREWAATNTAKLRQLLIDQISQLDPEYPLGARDRV